MQASYKKSLHAAFVVIFYLASGLHLNAQSNSGSLNGTVQDSSGAVVPGATVEIHNPVSHFDQSVTTDGPGDLFLPPRILRFPLPCLWKSKSISRSPRLRKPLPCRAKPEKICWKTIRLSTLHSTG